VNVPVSNPSRARRLAAAALVVACAMTPLLRADGLPTAPKRVGAAPGTGNITSVLGSAWNVDNTPIPGARLQLRNLVSGKVEAATIADQAGQFRFTRIAGGSYVVELVGDNGRILTVGHAFVIAPGETVATFVRLGTKVPWFSGFFSNAAAAVAATAAGQGITAIAPVQLPKTRQ
jgi:hypothetical protein